MYIRWHTFCHTVCIMEVRIDITSEGPMTVVHITGRLSGAAGAQLRKACDPIEGSFVLDLSNLLIADDAGIDVIHTLHRLFSYSSTTRPDKRRKVRNENHLKRL